MSGMRLFDNYEEDGQLSLFSADYEDWDEEWEETPEDLGESMEEQDALEQNAVESALEKEETGGGLTKSVKAKGSGTKTKTVMTGARGASEKSVIGAAVDTYEKAVAGLELTNVGPTIRVKYCASCGKLLFVKEETAGFRSECNNCGIKYFQKL